MCNISHKLSDKLILSVKESLIEAIRLHIEFTVVSDVGKGVTDVIPIYLRGTRERMQITLIIHVVNVEASESVTKDSYSILRLTTAQSHVT